MHHHLSALAGMSYQFCNRESCNAKFQSLGTASIIANDLWVKFKFKFGLPIESSPSKVKQRLQGENPIKDDWQMTALKQKWLIDIVGYSKNASHLQRMIQRKKQEANGQL